MALAYALHHIEANNLAKLTNYGEYLETHPPTHGSRDLGTNAPGVARTASSAGTAIVAAIPAAIPTGTRNGAHRCAKRFDWLRDTIAPRFEEKARELFRDPWGARNEYIHVVLES